MLIKILQAVQVAPGYAVLLPDRLVEAPDGLALAWIATGKAIEHDAPIKEFAVKKARKRKETRNVEH